jgi:ABC-type Mn2+/Zn2+ transport system permease subunit
MKRSLALWVNISFRVFVAFAYTLLGAYVAFWSSFDLGTWNGVSIVLLLGILFIFYGLFRIWRAYLYFREADESSNYAEYED